MFTHIICQINNYNTNTNTNIILIGECPHYSSIRKLNIEPYHIRKPSMFKLVALLNTDNVSEMQKLAIFIKRALVIHKDCLFN